MEGVTIQVTLHWRSIEIWFESQRIACPTGFFGFLTTFCYAKIRTCQVRSRRLLNEQALLGIIAKEACAEQSVHLGSAR